MKTEEQSNPNRLNLLIDPIKERANSDKNQLDAKINKERYLKTDAKTGKFLFKAGNPGRPKGSKNKTYSLPDLVKAIQRVEKEDKISYLVSQVRLSLTEPSMGIAILKKLISDMKLSDDEGVKIINIIRGGSEPAPKQEGVKPDAKIQAER